MGDDIIYVDDTDVFTDVFTYIHIFLFKTPETNLSSVEGADPEGGCEVIRLVFLKMLMYVFRISGNPFFNFTQQLNAHKNPMYNLKGH